MNIFSKILLAVLPLTLLNFIIAAATTNYFSHKAILEHAEAWLTTKLNEAVQIAEQQEKLLQTYGLAGVPASVKKAKMDAEQAIYQIEVGDSGYIFATDLDGNIVMHPDTRMLGKSVQGEQWYTQISSGKQPFPAMYKNEPHLMISTVFEPWDLKIIITDTEREIFRTSNRVKPFLIIFGLAGSLLLIAVLMYVIHRIIIPLKFLTRGVEQISRGDLSIRIPGKTEDEIGRLSKGFNRMAEEIDSSRQVLEQRVEERTGELLSANKELLQSIEEKNKAVEAWKSNERRIAAILRASPVGIGLVVDRRIIWANEALFTIVGYDKEELLNQDTRVLYPSEEEYVATGKRLSDGLGHGEVRKENISMKRADGREIECTVQVCHLDPEDSSKGIIFALEDITATRIMEEKLQRARKMEAIGTLAGGVAHDLNNILSGIVSYPELLLLDLEEDSPLKKPLETIKQSGERASVIVQDLLTMARRGVAVTDTVNLNTLIQQLVASPEIKLLLDCNPGVQIVQNLEDRIFNISGSEAHLSKCVSNLLNNAAESIENEGKVIISTENVLLEDKHQGYEPVPPGEYILLSVEDNGTGIPFSDLERIFEPFFTSKRMGRSGTGLGMAVVWGTVKDHRGFLDVTSREGVGTTFKIFFPCSDLPEAMKMAPESIDNMLGNGEKILVVDDSELQRELAVKILEKLKYSVERVESGEAAIEYFADNDADLILLDMIMPDGADGLDTYRAIHRIKSDQKVIIVSGFSETDRVRELQKLRNCKYLKKPYTIEGLGKAVSETLSESKQVC